MQPMRSRSEPDNDKDNESDVLDDFLEATVISPSSWWRKKSTWHIGRDDRLEMPSSLERLLDDYNLALIVESPNAKLIRPRLDAILIQILSVVKEARRKSGNGRFGISAILDAVFWGSRHRLCIAHDFQGCSYIVGCTVHYALWYGSRQDLETNFVVVRSNMLMEDECWMPLAAMSIIHYARKKAGRNAEIYGVCTDSYKWTFLHLNSKSQYSSLHLDWTKGQQEEIISQIGKIIKQAIEIAISEAQMNRRKMTVSQMTGCVVLEEQPKDGSTGDKTSALTSHLRLRIHYPVLTPTFANSIYYRTSPSYSTDMDYFERLRIQIDKSSAQGSAMRGKADIAEVPVVSRTVAQQGKRPATSENNDLPHITIADIQPQDVRRFLRLQPDPDPSSCWQLTAQDKIQGPEYLGSILSGYWRAAGRDSENKVLLRARLETILVAVLASKKRESASAYGSLHLQFEKNLSLPWSYQNKGYVLEGTTDYSIWERAGRNDTTVYGIVTDTDEWRFLCIDKESRYSGCIMSWDKGQQGDIISTIYKILNHAAALAQALEAPSLTEYRSVEDSGGLEWSD
ncbi:hypothetical protein IFM58399_10009 [Aspergillus lentulus]|uniref:uncharacterized protein n=1 Tax=Aspergillus lentulus TaxID=293939 RepID=UPI0013935D5F|nr:uncharacterized protein IFM58399_10009 [Aspergillus lentulus]GFF55194.1 hypothetical protein IFM58399_10009 [Aspergillus lentulus]